MFARIPRWRIRWLPNNVTVGRGASRWGSNKAHKAASAQFMDPDKFNAEFSSQQDAPRSGRWETDNPEDSVYQTDGNAPPAREGSGRIARRLNLLERGTGNGEFAIDEPAQSPEEEDNTLWAQEPFPHIPNKYANKRGPSLEELVHHRMRFSDQVHVLGLDLAGRYITHALAGCETIPPVRYLLHDPFLKKEWHKTGSSLTLHRGDTAIVRRRIIGEYVRVREMHEDRDHNWYVSDKPIQNLVITVPAGHVLRSLDPILHRLDHRSTICFLQDALGVMDDVAETFFPDESSRPVFLVGHFTSTLGHVHPWEENLFAVRELKQRTLFLSIPTARGGAIPGHIIKRHPPPEHTLRHTHLLKLLTAVPGLNASGHRYADMLTQKIFRVAFRAVAEPLATIVDSPYAGLEKNSFASQIMDKAIGEICDVVARLPEFRGIDRFRRAYLAPLMRKEMFGRLKAKGRGDALMRTYTARGWETDVDYLTGYFVRKGRELAVRVDALEMLLLLVKGKRDVALKRLDEAVPFP
ncbi:hypothetical protein QBC39DRAFT_363814 [Podospora conica]|nr:hypothetical protein QBC39DRAFT_363814 [Schizothecium conicum]